MSTLVMALATGMALGSGPEALSTEATPRLDLSGVWEGSWHGGSDLPWMELGRFCKAELKRGMLHRDDGEIISFVSFKIIDEGRGRVRVVAGSTNHLGIYEQRGDGLTICLRKAHDGRPTSFTAGRGHYLLILHRVKPRR